MSLSAGQMLRELSVILSIDTISPPSIPIVGPPKSFQTDQLQLHPGLRVGLLVFNVVVVKEVIDGVVDVCNVGVVYIFVILEKFWTEDFSVCSVVMPVENVGEAVDIVVGFVGMLLPVG